MREHLTLIGYFVLLIKKQMSKAYLLEIVRLSSLVAQLSSYRERETSLVYRV